ncbi:putative protein N(5)-glutamine methyltransferase [Saccharopolyspora rhizosphaerae]|uniref:peptide chain release factor N(5)-glutamine methyltransferase n=2 Tax=Saccharopolyspora rhizosphaerae TaxID=2492662 RepID=A0A426K5U7_9PSEU|nr:putative protein N(5)-glutamine methyltransferase [Saccharopolyspora rhizosphaerae]RRO20748.1 putative protein N(5)-glutamine methyltransferase [Saccharopolyspora rhizosphaerae]
MSRDAVVARLRAAGCVFAEDEAELLTAEAGEDCERLGELLAARESGLPLEQVVGWACFRGLRIAVLPGVFVPRRRTEHLVELAVEHVGAGDVVVDVCCGTAAVAAAVRAERPEARVWALDVDERATRCAQLNLPGAQVGTGDLFTPLPDRWAGRVRVVTANAPYVPSDAVALMPPEARDHEPRTALDGGLDGLAVQARVITEAPHWLAAGGVLLVETSQEQAERTAELMSAAGLVPRISRREDLDATVVSGRKR